MGSNTSYPVTNLSDRNKNVYWKALNANTSGYIDIDLSANRTCSYIILGNHNYTSTSIGIKLAYDSNNDGNYSSVYYVLGDAGSYHDYVAANVTNWLEVFSEQGSNKRYWRLYLEAQGAGTYQQIANIFIGFHFEHSVNWDYGDGLLGPVYGVETGETTGGIRRRQLNHDRRNIWEYGFSYIDETHKTNMETFLDSVYGSYYPFYMADENGTLYYVGLVNNEFPYKHIQYQLYGIRLRIEEEL